MNSTSRVRVAFMGTADLSCEILQALALRSADYEICAVVTQPDRARGRELKLQPTPVKVTAESLNLPVLQPARARDPQFVASIKAMNLDLCLVAAYGQILPPDLLDAPARGCLNVHTSLLPKYRGAAPIQWAVINGDAETGVTIMKMDVGLDTGDILTQARTQITPTDTSATLHDRLAKMGGELLLETVPGYLDGTIKPVPQDGSQATHAPKISKEDGQADWSRTANSLWNRLRGLTPWPGLFTFLPDVSRNSLLKIWEASPLEGSGESGRIVSAEKSGIVVGTGAGLLKLTVIQREGGRRMTAQEFLAGHPLMPGQKLGLSR